MMCPSRRRVGWGRFGPCKPRVMANGFNSSDIVCDSATDLNLCAGLFGTITPFRIRGPDQSEARKVPGFLWDIIRCSTFCFVLQKDLFLHQG
jgi:hypothetical protein